MRISDYLKNDFCVMNLVSKTKEDAIREISTNLQKSGKINDLEKFISDILEREKLGSTGIGYNIAIPHSRTEAVDGFVIGFGRSIEGIDFKSLDGEKVNLIFLMGANPKELNMYLRLLAELSRFLIDNSFRKALLSASSPQEIIEIFKKFEG
ncbi:MAG: PTS sugar transporter subunit IIA [Candidatus Omnitrophica bacterium]|nr:PTS sugar transporter subunit IIA [Candidatus Omnitrophota bacterium]